MFLAKESPIVDSVHPTKRSKKKAWYRNPLSGKNKSTKLDVLCCLNKKTGRGFLKPPCSCRDHSVFIDRLPKCPKTVKEGDVLADGKLNR